MECPISRCCMPKKEFDIKCGNGKTYPYCIAWDYAKDGVTWNEEIGHYEVPERKPITKSKRLKLGTNRLNLKTNRFKLGSN